MSVLRQKCRTAGRKTRRQTAPTPTQHPHTSRVRCWLASRRGCSPVALTTWFVQHIHVLTLCRTQTHTHTYKFIARHRLLGNQTSRLNSNPHQHPSLTSHLPSPDHSAAAQPLEPAGGLCDAPLSGGCPRLPDSSADCACGPRHRRQLRCHQRTLGCGSPRHCPARHRAGLCQYRAPPQHPSGRSTICTFIPCVLPDAS